MIATEWKKSSLLLIKDFVIKILFQFSGKEEGVVIGNKVPVEGELAEVTHCLGIICY